MSNDTVTHNTVSQCPVPRYLAAKCLVVMAAAGLTFASLAASATFEVTKTSDTNDGLCNVDCSLREAVQAVNLLALSGGDHVINLPTGTFRLSIAGASENAGLTGDLDIVAFDAPVSLEIKGSGQNATILDAGGLDRFFQLAPESVVSDLDVVISDLTIRGGRTPGASFEDGGGIFNAGTLTLRRVTLEDNATSSFSSTGGGLYNFGDATLENCAVRNNTTSGVAGVGGGIANEGTMRVTDTTVEGNSVEGTDANGGGLSSSGSLVLLRSTVSGNSVLGGQTGGGLFLTGSAEVTNSTVSGNSAGEGGGVGAIDLSGTFLNVTVANNSAAAGSAIVTDGDIDLTLTNTLIDGSCKVDSSLATGGGNVESPGATCGLGFDDQVLVSSAELLLGALSNNGGPTRTHALLSGSVAIDAGVESACPSNDQRGADRPGDGNDDGVALCDVGAFELEDLGVVDGPGCSEGATTLCLNGNRFRVTVEWTTGSGDSGQGQAVELTADTGYFWFFDVNNVEMVVKVLDGCPLNGNFWVFAGGLTDVQVDLTLVDTETNTVKTYSNPQGTPFQPIQDTLAFATCP